MKKILLLLVISLLGIGLFGQSKFKKGIQVGRNGATVDSITVDGDYIYFHSGEDKWSNDTLNGIAGISNKVDINTAYRDTFKNLKSGYINVKDYGAAGDGVTNDRDAIYNAILNAKGKTVIFPSGQYVMNGTISITGMTHPPKLMGLGNVVLDWTGYLPPALNSDYLQLYGDTTYVGGITSDAVHGGRTIDVGDTSLFSINDYIMIMSTDSWSGTWLKGEVVKVKDFVNENTVELYDALYDDYPSATTKLKKTISGECFIKNIKIEAPTFFHPDSNRVRFVSLRFLNDITISDVTINNANYYNLSVDFFKNLSIINYKSTRSLRTGFGYGISVGAGNDVVITNCNITGCRHAITTGGYFPLRNMIVSNNILKNASGWTYAFDTHPGAEYITVTNNHLSGGAEFRSPNFKFNHNTLIVDDSVIDQAIIYAPSLHSPQFGDFEIKNNTVKHIGTRTPSSSAISINFTSDNDTIWNGEISGNIMDFFNNGIRISTSASGIDSSYIDYIKIKDNKMITSGAGYPLLLGSENGDLIFNNVFIENNILENTIGTTSAYIRAKKINEISISNNKFIADDNLLLLYNSSINNATVYNNNFIAKTTPSYYGILISDAGRVYLHDNIFNDNHTIPYQILSSVDTLYYYNNNYKGNPDNEAQFSFAGNNSEQISIDNIIPFKIYNKVDDSLNIVRNPILDMSYLNVAASDTVVVRLYFLEGTGRRVGYAKLTSFFYRGTGNPEYHAHNEIDIYFNRYTSTIESVRSVNSEINRYIVPYPTISFITYDNVNYVDVLIINTDSSSDYWFGTMTNYYNLLGVKLMP